jgi:hypothetical protein
MYRQHVTQQRLVDDSALPETVHTWWGLLVGVQLSW